MRIAVVACAVASLVAASAFAADDVQTLADRAEIGELITRYVTALDGLDADAYEGVFTVDGEYDVTGTVYKGRPAIRKIVTDLQASRARNEAAGTPSPQLYHVMANHSIEIVDATNARHQSYAQTVRLADSGQFVVGFMGRYEDVLVKLDGRWYIKSRKLVSFIPPRPAAAPAAR
jgi:uncharacterized protein (TIGR02246 family)